MTAIKLKEVLLWRGTGAPSPDLSMAVARLVAGTITHHILDCQTWAWPGEEPFKDPATCEGCCPVCCAPCAALIWFRDEANDWLTEWLNEWSPNGGCVWQLPDGSVNWAFIEVHWKPGEIGCHDEGDLMDMQETVDLAAVDPDRGVLPVRLRAAAFDAVPSADAVRVSLQPSAAADPGTGNPDVRPPWAGA